jgi:hypothetical protein
MKKSDTAESTAAAMKLAEELVAAPSSEGSEPAEAEAEEVGRRVPEDDGPDADGDLEAWLADGVVVEPDSIAAVAEPLAEAPPEAVTPPMTGGGLAMEGSARAPTPQGMGALVPGWFAFSGGTVSPSGEVMVKRVTQVLTSVWGLVNW